MRSNDEEFDVAPGGRPSAAWSPTASVADLVALLPAHAREKLTGKLPDGSRHPEPAVGASFSVTLAAVRAGLSVEDRLTLWRHSEEAWPERTPLGEIQLRADYARGVEVIQRFRHSVRQRLQAAESVDVPDGPLAVYFAAVAMAETRGEWKLQLARRPVALRSGRSERSIQSDLEQLVEAGMLEAFTGGRVEQFRLAPVEEWGVSPTQLSTWPAPPWNHPVFGANGLAHSFRTTLLAYSADEPRSPAAAHETLAMVPLRRGRLSAHRSRTKELHHHGALVAVEGGLVINESFDWDQLAQDLGVADRRDRVTASQARARLDDALRWTWAKELRQSGRPPVRALTPDAVVDGDGVAWPAAWASQLLRSAASPAPGAPLGQRYRRGPSGRPSRLAGRRELRRPVPMRPPMHARRRAA